LFSHRPQLALLYEANPVGAISASRAVVLCCARLCALI